VIQRTVVYLVHASLLPRQPHGCRTLEQFPQAWQLLQRDLLSCIFLSFGACSSHLLSGRHGASLMAALGSLLPLGCITILCTCSFYFVHLQPHTLMAMFGLVSARSC